MTAAVAGTAAAAAAADRAVAPGTALAAPTQAPKRPGAPPPTGRLENVRSISLASAYQDHYSPTHIQAWLESVQKARSRRLPVTGRATGMPGRPCRNRRRNQNYRPTSSCRTDDR